MTVIIPEIRQPVTANVLLPPIKCSFSIEQVINAPIEVVWSIVRQFDNPKAYRMFIGECSSTSTSNAVGSFRHIAFVTDFPSTVSIERLDDLNEEKHVMVYSVVGGDHTCRLPNYQGMISVKEKCSGGQRRTIVTEKYTVYVPEDSNAEETRYLVDTLVGFNLKSLARIAECI